MENKFTVSFLGDKLVKLVHDDDSYQMNWVKKNCAWGNVKLKHNLDVTIERKKIGSNLEEQFIFTNKTDRPIFTSISDIAIEVPFPDEYIDAITSETLRCHTHLWCGENSSYITGIRMNGEGPHLGLILKEGSLVKYSVKRDTKNSSNDRGIFLIHPEPLALLPGEKYILSWDLVWFKDREEFEKIRLTYPNQIKVKMTNFLQQEKENNQGLITCHGDISKDEITLRIDQQKVPLIDNGGNLEFTLNNLKQKEYEGIVSYGKFQSHFKFLVYPQFEDLMTNRVEFLLNKQQVLTDNLKDLKGSFLCYDNEEEHSFYSVENDYNAGRERVCMGLALISYAAEKNDPRIEKHLDLWISYLLQELINPETGQVFDDYHEGKLFRLYNYPWVMIICHELYLHKKDAYYIHVLAKIIRKYYELGGLNHYPIGLWFSKWLPSLEAELAENEFLTIKNLFKQHADQIIATDVYYPPFEVKYEQSIIAPAVATLLEAYAVFGENRYLEEAKKHLKLLELFEGYQPDYHLYHTAIRHWDGYWFGKNKMFGDTFPHYWSGLNGMIYLKFYELLGEKEYLTKANYSIRGVLSLISPDGKGSCAYLYPYTVNGKAGEFYDPMANDQDWGLYFLTKLLQSDHK